MILGVNPESASIAVGHHYQRDEVLAFADIRGDSLKLARDASQSDAEFIILCGVRLMAETAATLARQGQRVFIPDPTAGCFLADAATPEGVQSAWEYLNEVLGDSEAECTPITYVNSSTELKSFCGRRGGTVCTSGNVENVLRWALRRRPRVFFFPDQHLGRNMARRLGIPQDQAILWDEQQPLDAETTRASKMILWPGCCIVHQRFRPEHVSRVRAQFAGIRVLVHPECDAKVVDLVDAAGSTAHIIEQVGAAPPGTCWAIGTETRLVDRLQQAHPEPHIVSLASIPPFCRNMGQITLHNLAVVLERLAAGEPVNEVSVDSDEARWARVALERMLTI